MKTNTINFDIQGRRDYNYTLALNALANALDMWLLITKIKTGSQEEIAQTKNLLISSFKGNSDIAKFTNALHTRLYHDRANWYFCFTPGEIKEIIDKGGIQDSSWKIGANYIIDIFKVKSAPYFKNGGDFSDNLLRFYNKELMPYKFFSYDEKVSPTTLRDYNSNLAQQALANTIEQNWAQLMSQARAGQIRNEEHLFELMLPGLENDQLFSDDNTLILSTEEIENQIEQQTNKSSKSIEPMSLWVKAVEGHFALEFAFYKQKYNNFSYNNPKQLMQELNEFYERKVLPYLNQDFYKNRIQTVEYKVKEPQKQKFTGYGR